MPDYNIEDYIPHRDGMKLIDKIIKINNDIAVTSSVAGDEWPLAENGRVNSIVMIELVAQTACLFEAWKKKEESGSSAESKIEIGWLIGVKNAVFNIPDIPLQTELTTTVIKQSSHGDVYLISEGSVSMGPDIIGKITIQGFRPDIVIE